MLRHLLFPAPRPRRRDHGFTLVECMVACSVAATLTAVALPGWRAHRLQAARIDAVDALTRLQFEQERHYAIHGAYAADLSALGGGASRQGRYALTLRRGEAETYTATAQAQGEQAGDGECAALTLEVRQGVAHIGPSASCWNR